MIGWVILGLVIAFLVFMIRYTGEEFFVLALAWCVGVVFLLILGRLSRDITFLSGVRWDAVQAFYWIVGVATLLPYIEFRRRWPYPRLNAQQLFERSLALYEQGDTKQALRAARQMVAKSPLRVEYIHLLSKILNRQGKYRAAVRRLKFAQDLQPNSSAILIEIGFAFRMLGKYRQALDALEQAIALEPDNADIAKQIEVCRQKLQGISRS